MLEKTVYNRKHSAKEDVQFMIMQVLQANPDMNQRDLAAHVGISLGSLNFCLRALMNKGFVKLESFQNSKHKFKYVYILTPDGIAQKIALTRRFLKRKIQEYEALKAEIKSLEVQLGVCQGAGSELVKSNK
jgi:EPS-associated MarR family transcriptional regulator